MSAEISAERLIVITVVKESKLKDFKEQQIFHNNFGEIVQKLYSYDGFKSIQHDSCCKSSKGKTTKYIHTYTITFSGNQNVEHLIYNIRALF